MREFENELKKRLAPTQILLNEDMGKHTSFQAGGSADFFLKPESVEQLQAVLELCMQYGVAYTVIGKGTNLLVRDKGYRGVIIQILKGFDTILEEEDGEDRRITAGAGATLAAVANAAMKRSLAGFEFASGIPGALGGGVYMNAGAYDGEIAQVFEDALVLRPGCGLVTLNKVEMDFDYRTSRAQKEEMIIMRASLRLKKGDAKEIKEKMADLNRQRKEKQPLELPSAGSTFKRPEGYFAGKLIMDSGFSGYSIGGAAVSEKHCGFIVNKGAATAADVINLIEYVQEKVFSDSGVRLVPEVRIIGER